MKDIRQRLLATFQIEHRDHVEQIRSLLAMIEKTAGPPAGVQLDEAFRRAHSLKGAARAVDLKPVEDLAHHLETLFFRVRQGVLPLNQEVAGVVQQVLDVSEDCVTGLSDNRPALGLGPALQAIEQVLGVEPETQVVTIPEPRESVPAFQPLDTVRIAARNFDGLLRSAAGLLTESHRQDQVAEQLSAMTHQIGGMKKEAEYMHRFGAESLRKLRARGEFSRVGSFLDSMEKQVHSLSKQASAARSSQRRSSWTMQRLGEQLQRDVWQARMMPAEGLLEGYRKMMRDLARDESKEIEFRATSSGVHADRGVLEALKDPLMHMLRNALSHGIEKPQERAAKGKPRAGLVTLRVDAKGQRLTIAIEDDGRGVDLARVAEVAVRERIITAPEADHRSPEELAQILFRPGFSTAQSVTGLSGRGMGLSVVYEAVRRLQGDLECVPREGCGTAFRLAVPLSISMQKLLLIDCAGQCFAVPIHAIERLHRLRLTSVETIEGKPVVMLDGQAVPLFALQQLLSLDDQQSPSAGEREVLRVMILRFGAKRAAVAVGAFLRETDAVIHDLGPARPRDGRVAGGILLDDGTVGLVLNPIELLENSVHRALQIVPKPSEPAREKAARSILVVDDSMTTRMLEKNILEAHGYRVRVAVDGMEAMALLRNETADLVITDVQMPRMDGLALLEALKKDPDLSRIPVIMVTSLERREDQERGLSLGADAYIVKRKFDQAELLAAIRQIL
jgi:two-component system chemotaxis sensor kinase CheA